MNWRFISNSRGFGSENYSLFLTLWARSMHIENFNVLVRPWSKTNDITKDEYGSCLEPICSSILYQGRTNILKMSMLLTSNLLLPSHRRPFMDEARYTRYTISCPLVHRGCPWEGAIEKKKHLCHVSQFNWLSVVSISFLEMRATCHFLTGSCRFICLGQLPIYSGIPPVPSTFAKFSPLTFLV